MFGVVVGISQYDTFFTVVNVWYMSDVVASVSQGCAFHIRYAAALHRVNNAD